MHPQPFTSPAGVSYYAMQAQQPWSMPMPVVGQQPYMQPVLLPVPQAARFHNFQPTPGSFGYNQGLQVTRADAPADDFATVCAVV